MSGKTKSVSLLLALALLLAGAVPESVLAGDAVYKVSERKWYMYDGGPLEHSETYEYDKDGNLIKREYYISPDEDSIGSKGVIYYSYEENRLMCQNNYIYLEDGSKKKSATITYKYNDAGQMILMESVDSSVVTERTKYQYSNGKLVRMVNSTYKNDGSFVNRFIYKYSYGKNSEIAKVYDKNHAPKSKGITFFDKNGNDIGGKGYVYENGKWVFRGMSKRAYDKENRLIRYEDYDADGKIEEKETYTYNKYGDCTVHVYYTYSKSGKYRKEVVRCSYEYDEHGNKTKSIVTPGGVTTDNVTTYKYVKIGG